MIKNQKIYKVFQVIIYLINLILKGFLKSSTKDELDYRIWPFTVWLCGTVFLSLSGLLTYYLFFGDLEGSDKESTFKMNGLWW